MYTNPVIPLASSQVLKLALHENDLADIKRTLLFNDQSIGKLKPSFCFSLAPL